MKKIFYLFVLVTLISCNRASNDEASNRSIQIRPENAKEAFLSEVYESIEYIFLKKSDQFPLVRPSKFKIHKGLLGIEDVGGEQYVFFDLEGNPLFKIVGGGSGGPGEFKRTEDFQISDEGIVIKDPMQSKFLFFDREGNFLHEEKSKIRTSYFIKDSEIELHYSKNIREHGDFEFYKIEDDQITSMVPSQSLEKDVVYADKDGFVTDRARNLILFRLPYSNKVVFFNGHGDLVEILEFNFGDTYLSEQQQAKLTPAEKDEVIMRENLITGISSFFPMEKGYILNFGSGYRYSHQVFLDQDFTVKEHFNKLNNDLDQMPLKTVPWFFHQDQLGFYIPSSEFFADYLDRFEIGNVDRENSNLHQFVEKYQNELGGDSYVLTFLKVKKGVFTD